MKILVLQTAGDQKGFLEEWKERISEDCPGAEVKIWDTAGCQALCAEIKKEDPDLLICFDLAGFEQSTLMGGIAYNLLNCKQIHVLLRKKTVNETYLGKPLSISMFFYCTDHEYYLYLLGTYPDIPYLREMSGKSAEALHDAVSEVMKICHMK